MLVRPELVTQAVLMGTRGRLDATRKAFRAADLAMADSAAELPRLRGESSCAGELLTQDHQRAGIGDWMEMFTAFPLRRTPGWRAQLTVAPTENRLPSYRSIAAEVLVIGFADDVITRRRWAARWGGHQGAAMCRSPMPATSVSWSAPSRSTPRCWTSSRAPSSRGLTLMAV